MKKFIIGLVCLTLLVSVTACGGGSSPSASQTPAPSNEQAATQEAPADASGANITIGYACADLNNTFQTYLVDAARNFADANGVGLTVTDAQQDVIFQQNQVETMIQNNISALVVSPSDTSAMGPVTNVALGANVPLVYVNSNPYTDSDMPAGVYYVGSLETTGGRLQMEKAGELMSGEGNVFILIGDPGYEASRQRTEGVKEIIAEKYPNIKVVSEEVADWQREKAVTVTENWLTAHGDNVNAIIANNDEMALGAIQALTAAGRSDVIVIGIDAIPDAVKAIEAGTMAASVFQDAAGQAGGAMQVALDVLNNNPPSEQILWVPFILVDEKNFREYLD